MGPGADSKSSTSQLESLLHWLMGWWSTKLKIIFLCAAKGESSRGWKSQKVSTEAKRNELAFNVDDNFKGFEKKKLH